MTFVSKYQAKSPNQEGIIDYTIEEHQTWSILYRRMMTIIDRYACQEHLDGLQKLELKQGSIPQVPMINNKLQALTGWSVAPVSALIPLDEFFSLLANKKFPVATFIRAREELDYVTEPDVFHEVFGHCPLLTNQAFADFTQRYGEYALTLSEADALLLQRLYWFTVEFGLINTQDGLRCYGGGILSSFQETQYAVDASEPVRFALAEGVDALRTPYRIDEPQKTYFIIDSFAQLYHVLDNPKALIERARLLGEFPARFTVDPNNPNMHVFAC